MFVLFLETTFLWFFILFTSQSNILTPIAEILITQQPTLK